MDSRRRRCPSSHPSRSPLTRDGWGRRCAGGCQTHPLRRSSASGARRDARKRRRRSKPHGTITLSQIATVASNGLSREATRAVAWGGRAAVCRRTDTEHSQSPADAINAVRRLVEQVLEEGLSRVKGESGKLGSRASQTDEWHALGVRCRAEARSRRSRATDRAARASRPAPRGSG